MGGQNGLVDNSNILKNSFWIVVGEFIEIKNEVGDVT